eukprot:CAMPEP_0113878250 /NCGR_PEP_ID=MMETSP0780_2-20120614/6567_1 /TAXON_ID=652834 /ORGANISM="Palpitomonas bilix" /LENGTH=106 /DNA_ID=CAMNT_0000864677 /DNA_START=113 /DNA_END=433 /DNA_ORIENTATION=+ /assembly_acc=CAM_ASM_000599
MDASYFQGQGNYMVPIMSFAIFVVLVVILRKPVMAKMKFERLRDSYDEKIMNLLRTRDDMVYHYQWAKSEGEMDKMKQMDASVDEIERKIKKLDEERSKALGLKHE